MVFWYTIKVMKNLLIIPISFLLIQCEPIVPQSSTINKKIFYDDFNYESIVGNVDLAPIRNGVLNTLENPVISLENSDQLAVSFDLLTDQFENLSAKIVHCNKDWTRSQLRDMEFLNEINNYRVTEFDYSVNTTQPYINYRLAVAKPMISGNYILAIFRRANPDDILFTRKFLVVEPKSRIEQLVRMSTTIAKREENHQIEFSINYGNVLVNSPTQDISTMILQNHNWRTSKNNLQPTLIRANEGFLEYRHLDLSANFPAWNDFRFTDIRTLDVAGRNVAKINKTTTTITAFLGADTDRSKRTYTQNFEDINGDYLIQNTDIGDVPLNADYAKLQFQLKAPKINAGVYVTGRFNNWKLLDENRMSYDEANGTYFTNLFLKQGYYEYMYYVDSPSLQPYHFEGSYFLAENDYEIIVYYRRPGNINDEIIGYKKFKSR